MCWHNKFMSTDCEGHITNKLWLQKLSSYLAQIQISGTLMGFDYLAEIIWCRTIIFKIKKCKRDLFLKFWCNCHKIWLCRNKFLMVQSKAQIIWRPLIRKILAVGTYLNICLFVVIIQSQMIVADEFVCI